ncbi:MAG: peroxide stress protein YaaA, partial [Actinobacteria bacterium]|nr:peroxide stress protein YaaA [Actinomycetota bacterium]
MSKHYRGLLTRMLVTQSRAPKSPQELLEVAATVFDCELTPSKNQDPWFLDLIINSS